MRRALVSAITVALLSGLLSSSRAGAGEDELVGNWAGGFEEGEDYVFLQLHFRAEDGRLSGTYDAPLLFQQAQPLARLGVRSSSVEFEVPAGPDPRVFTGELKAGTLVGHVQEGATRRPFRFTRLAPIEGSDYTGAYEIESGRFLFLRTAVETGLDALQLIDFETGRIAVLFPTSATTFFTGPAILVPHPVEATVTFTRDGEGRAMELAWDGARAFRAKRVESSWQDVAFTHDGIRLAGELILPDSPGPHPAIVFSAGGSSYGTREMFCFLAEFFALHGVAGLVYDKRGLGSSGGDWLRAGFGDLAGDTLAGVDRLRTHADIDARRIGLLGSSQSGWIVALAASRSDDVAFIISLSGPGVTPAESELYRSEAWLRADGFSEAEIRDAMRFVRRRYRCARTGEGWEALAEAARDAGKERWFAYTGGHVGKDHPFWHFWSLIRDYDPVPVMEQVTCPVLAVFGAKDTFLPAEKSARIWREALDEAGNDDVTIRVFPHGDHSLIESETGGLRETARARRFVPGYFELLRDWTLERTRRKD